MHCISPQNMMIDEIGRMDVPCGKCYQCLNQKRNDWSFRLYQEQKVSQSAVFITLTYNDDEIPKMYDPETGEVFQTLKKEDFQSFMKTLRKRQARKTKKWKIRYYAVGEYGTETQRPHYHAILFNTHLDVLKTLDAIWKKGITHIGECNPASIRYITKYVINKIGDHDVEKPFALMSRKPGLGENYLTKNKKYHRQTEKMHVINERGKYQKLPRFYQDKIWSKGEKATIKYDLSQKAEKKRWKEQDDYAKKGKNYFKAEIEHHEHNIKKVKKFLNKKNNI